MKFLKWAAILAVTAVVALYFTKPSPRDVRNFVEAQALSQLRATDLKPSDKALADVGLIACKLKPDSCGEVLNRLIDIKYRDKILYAVVTVTGIGPPNRCTAIFKKLLCQSVGQAQQ